MKSEMKPNMKQNFMNLAAVVAFSAAGIAMGQQKIDAAKSMVKWEGEKRIVGGHQGTINIKAADLSFDLKGEPVSGKIVMDLKSIVVTDKDLADDKKGALKGHLESKDFFEVEKFPEATYVAKKFTKVAGQKLKYTVDGDMTIKGITNAQKIAMEIKTDKTGNSTVVGELDFDRTLYNVMYSSGKLADTAKDKMIKDEVALDIHLALIK